MPRFTHCILLSIYLCIISSSIQSKEIQFLDPIIIDQSFSDLTEKQHSPNLFLDSTGYILSYHVNGINGFNIKTIRLQTEPQFYTISEYLLFDSTQVPLLPTLRHIDTKNIFFYYDLLINQGTNDTLYKQKLLMHANFIPTIEETDNALSFFTLTKALAFPPQFVKTENRVYCELIKNELTDPNNNKREFFLRSLDYETGDLFSPILHFSANGKTAMAPYGDSLLLVKSWIFCTEVENLSCVKWATGYKAYVIFENKIVDIHSLSSSDVASRNLQPDDVFVLSINEESMFALRQTNQLMKINFATMRFEEVLDISLYTNQSYKQIIPLLTVDYCIVILIDDDNNGTIMRFDSELQYIDSVTIPFEGTVSEISEFVYDESNDMLSYAYATDLFGNSQTSRIFLQSVLFDKELVLNPPPGVPNIFTLSQNYPNPFNPSTTINYNIPQNGHVVVDIYNMLGQKVSRLYDNSQTAGEHTLDWDATEQSSGMYLFKVSYDDQTKSIKTLLLK